MRWLGGAQHTRMFSGRELPDLTQLLVADLQKYLVVDKTPLLGRILTNRRTNKQGTPAFLVATAPRRFGKSFVIEQLAALARWEKDDVKAFAGYAVRGARGVWILPCHHTGRYVLTASC